MCAARVHAPSGRPRRGRCRTACAAPAGKPALSPVRATSLARSVGVCSSDWVTRCSASSTSAATSPGTSPGSGSSPSPPRPRCVAAGRQPPGPCGADGHPVLELGDAGDDGVLRRGERRGCVGIDLRGHRHAGRSPGPRGPTAPPPGTSRAQREIDDGQRRGPLRDRGGQYLLGEHARRKCRCSATTRSAAASASTEPVRLDHDGAVPAGEGGGPAARRETDRSSRRAAGPELGRDHPRVGAGADDQRAARRRARSSRPCDVQRDRRHRAAGRAQSGGRGDPLGGARGGLEEQVDGRRRRPGRLRLLGTPGRPGRRSPPRRPPSSPART